MWLVNTSHPGSKSKIKISNTKNVQQKTIQTQIASCFVVKLKVIACVEM